MWIIKFYGLNFDNTPETGNGNAEEINYSEKLNTINQKIDELKKEDKNTENDANAKKELNDILTDSFNAGFVESLDGNQKAMLKDSITNVLDFHKNEPNFRKEYKWLIDLATALGVNLEWGTETSEQPTEPKLELSWTLSWIEGPKKKEDWTYEEWEKKLYSQLTREAPQGWQNIPDDKNFYKTAKDVKTQLEDVKWLLKNEKLKDNESLKWLEDKLGVIQTVIDNTTPDNVKILQKFISENLDVGSKDKKDFDAASKIGENFDWKFWVGTLIWLNIVLLKIWKYIDSFKNKRSEWAEGEPLKDVKVKKDIKFTGWDAQIKAADLLEGTLPDGADPEFKDGKWINVQETTKSQEVTVVVKNKDGKKLGEIKITAKIDGDKIKLTKQESWVNGSVESSKLQEWNKSPDGGQDEKPQPKSRLFGWYPREDSVSVSQMDGTVLFASQFVSPEHSGNVGGGWNIEIAELNKKVESAVNTLKNLWLKEWINENVYLMELGNKTLAVRLDSWNCLYPLAVDVATWEQIFLVNNPSCVQYLKNKLRNSLWGNYNVSIWWDWKDYVIWNQSYNKWLTIEPMTIAGKWVSQDLSQCLAFLNFTNYLRNEPWLDRWKFNNDNPDLKLDDNNVYVKVKEMDKNEKRKDDYSRTWMHVDLNQFWINFDPISLGKFKKYNNHEDWDDNWDKKKENQYSYLDLWAEIKKQEADNKSKVSSSQTGDYISHNPSAVANWNSIDKPSETWTHVVSLSQVAWSFDISSFWLDNSAKFYESGPVGNKSYYWLKDQRVFRLESPYCVKQEAILSDGQTFDGNKLPQGLNFKPVSKFNVCEQWAQGLTNEIKNVYKSIKGNNDELDAQITVDNGIYVLKWGEDSSEKTIQLSGDNFLKDGKIFGYDINEPEKWMKVVCYAVDNYDNLAKGDAVSKNESYWIYEDNVSSVKDWMTKLGALEVLNSSSVIWS